MPVPLTADPATMVASFVSEALPLPFPGLVSNTDLHIDFPDFNCHLAAEITDFRLDRELGKVTVQAQINRDVIVTLSLLGTLDSVFRIKEFWVDVKKQEETPRAELIASTLVALLGLSGKTDLRIPAIALELSLSFDLSLMRISQRLQSRQAAHRLMIIERATGLELSLPETYSSEDVRTITYLYHAIIDRSFFWPVGTITVHVPATRERLDMFPRDDTPTRTPLGPRRVRESLFGHVIDVGEEELFIDDAVIENLPAVRAKLAYDDNHPVEVKIRSLTGTGRVELRNAPELPDKPWDASTQALIDIEPQLDAALSFRLNVLAASTLADLTDEEKEEITARAVLDEEAFPDELL